MNKKDRIIKELQNAYKAQQENKDGLARVCARRAAGWAIQIKLNEQGIDLQPPSALDHIKYLKGQDNNPPDLQQILDHLVKRVEKDNLEEDSYWPLPDVDLVKEAHWLAEKILGAKLDL